MADRCEVRLSGAGGQGLILAGQILAKAASVYGDQNAIQSSPMGRRPGGARASRMSSSAWAPSITPRLRQSTSCSP